MPAARRPRALLALAGALLGAPQVGGQLLRGLPSVNVDPGALAAPLAGKSPAELAQAVKDHVAAAGRPDIADKLTDFMNTTWPKSADSLRDVTQQHLNNAMEDLSELAGPNVTEAVQAVLQHGAAAIANGSAADFQGALQGAAGSLDLSGGGLPQLEAFRPKLEEGIHERTPQVWEVAEAVNRTGLQMAALLQKHSPEVAGLVNSTGHEVAARLVQDSAPPGAHVPTMPHADEDVPVEGEGQVAVEGRSLASLSGVLLVVLTVAATYLVIQRYKGPGQRSPMLLSDALEGVSARSARAPVLRPGAQEPLCTMSSFQQLGDGR